MTDWIQCSTCNGEGVVTYADTAYSYPKPCPDCVGGLQPSAELVERVARGIGFLDFDLPFEFCLRAAWAALLASRQGDPS